MTSVSLSGVTDIQWWLIFFFRYSFSTIECLLNDRHCIRPWGYEDDKIRGSLPSKELIADAWMEGNMSTVTSSTSVR